MTQKELKQIIIDNGYEEIVLFENYDYVTAFIGISNDNKAIYDYDLMIEYLMKKEEFDDEIDAIEWIDYNTIRALPYMENAPIIKYNLL
jgi:hypothetical protein